MTVEEQFAEIRALLKPFAVTTVYHDDQIEALDRRTEALLLAAEKHDAQIAEFHGRTAEKRIAPMRSRVSRRRKDPRSN